MPYTPNNPYVPGDPYSYDLKWLVQNIKQVEAAIEYLKNSYTTPTVVDLASEMTDKNKIYVYMGSEIGYNTNHWYYYDPDTNLWTDGGVYGALAPDDALDIASHNAVENSVITAALATKFDTADIDSALDSSSTNPVQNKVIDAALATKFDTADIDNALDSSSTNPVQNKVIKTALDGKQNSLSLPLSVPNGGTNSTTTTQDTSTSGIHYYYWGNVIVMDIRGVAVNSSGSIGTIPLAYRPLSYFYAACDVETSANNIVPGRITIEGNGNTLVQYYNGTKFVTATSGAVHANITILNRRAE